MAGACEGGNEPSVSTKCGEFLDQLRTGLLLRKDSTPWSYLGSQLVSYLGHNNQHSCPAESSREAL